LTSQPEPAQTDAKQASQTTKPLRDLTALVLLGADVLLLLAGLINLVIPAWEDDTFTRRAGVGFFEFLGFTSIVLPLLAVLLVTHIQPVTPKAKLTTVAALGAYAFAALLGVVSLFGWLIGSLVDGEFRQSFTGLLVRFAYLAIFAVAAFTVFKIWRAHFYVAKPKPQPGVYGQPQAYGQTYPAGYPQGYAQQPGYQPGYAQAYGQQAAGYGQAAQDAQQASSVYGQPTAYQAPSTAGQPSTYTAGQPTVPAQSSVEATQVVGSTLPSPSSAPPSSAPPASAPPSSAPPAQSSVEATQVVGSTLPSPQSAPPGSAGSQMLRWPDADDRTQLMDQVGQRPSEAPLVDNGDDQRQHR